MVDSVVDDEALLRAYDEQMRGISNPRRANLIIEHDGPLLRVAGRFRGLVCGPQDLGVGGAELDTLIARQRDYFAARGEAIEWKTRGHDRPADLTDRLRAAGFVPEEQSTVLVGIAADIAADPVLPAGVTLRRVTGAADFRAIMVMESEVWGQDWTFLADDLVARTKAEPDDIVVFAVTDEATGEVISAAWLIFRPGTDFSYMSGGSTLKAWRNLGIYRALVAARAQRALARGARYMSVDASDNSAPILRRLGFRAITTITHYVWAPPAAT